MEVLLFSMVGVNPHQPSQGHSNSRAKAAHTHTHIPRHMPMEQLQWRPRTALEGTCGRDKGGARRGLKVLQIAMVGVNPHPHRRRPIQRLLDSGDARALNVASC